MDRHQPKAAHRPEPARTPPARPVADHAPAAAAPHLIRAGAGLAGREGPAGLPLHHPTAGSARFAAVAALQRTHGNAHVQRLLAALPASDGGPDRVQRDSRRDKPAKQEPAKETGGGAIPWTRFQSWATKAIEKYEGGATDGLNDFEKNVKDPSAADWQTFALNTVGNVVWALACFATGGTAFFISLAGIAIAAGATAAVMAEPKASFDLTRFHHHVRQAVSGSGGVVEQLNGKVVEASQAMEREAAGGKWTDPNQAHRALLERLFAGPQFIREEGGLPTVNRWAVAKKTEAELLILAASSVPSGSPEWKKERYPDEGVYLDLTYVAPDAMENAKSTKVFSQWNARLKKATIWDTTGFFPNMAERLNAIYGQTLKGPIPINQWPFRQEISVVVGADTAHVGMGGPPYVGFTLTRKGDIRWTSIARLREDPGGRAFLIRDDDHVGRMKPETGKTILLYALQPDRVLSLDQIETGGK